MHLCKLWVSWVLYCRLIALGKWNEMGFNFGVKNWRFICSFVLLSPPPNLLFSLNVWKVICVDILSIFWERWHWVPWSSDLEYSTHIKKLLLKHGLELGFPEFLVLTGWFCGFLCTWEQICCYQLEKMIDWSERGAMYCEEKELLEKTHRVFTCFWLLVTYSRW